MREETISRKLPDGTPFSDFVRASRHFWPWKGLDRFWEARDLIIQCWDLPSLPVGTDPTLVDIRRDRIFLEFRELTGPLLDEILDLIHTLLYSHHCHEGSIKQTIESYRIGWTIMCFAHKLGDSISSTSSYATKRDALLALHEIVWMTLIQDCEKCERIYDSIRNQSYGELGRLVAAQNNHIIGCMSREELKRMVKEPTPRDRTYGFMYEFTVSHSYTESVYRFPGLELAWSRVQEARGTSRELVRPRSATLMLPHSYNDPEETSPFFRLPSEEEWELALPKTSNRSS